MDASVLFLKYELASTIDQAVRSAVETVLIEIARVVDTKLAAAHSAAAESQREKESLREKLEITESELKAVRYYVTAAEKNIKQCLTLNQTRPMSPPTEHSCGDRDALLTLPHTHVHPLGSGVISRRRAASFRESRARTGQLESARSVGLCVPTVQTRWTSGNFRQRTRTSANSSLLPLEGRQFHPEAELGTGDELLKAGEDEQKHMDASQTDVDLEGCDGRLEDVRMVGTARLPVDTGSTKFEFAVDSPVASTVNELGLIRVLEDGGDDGAGAIKIEDEPELGVVMEPSDQTMEQLLPVFPHCSEEPSGVAELQLQLPEPPQSPDKVHRCNVCGRGFRRFYSLKTHQRIHTGERPYPCHYCEKRFRHLDSLQKHQRIHTGEKPYRCAQCARCFRELGHLKKHRLTHAATPATPPVSAPDPPYCAQATPPIPGVYTRPYITLQPPHQL